MTGVQTCALPISFSADNVTLDCAGFEVDSPGGGNAVYSEGVSGWTVKNCFFNNFSSGFFLNETVDAEAYSNTVVVAADKGTGENDPVSEARGVTLFNSNFTSFHSNSFNVTEALWRYSVYLACTTAVNNSFYSNSANASGEAGYVFVVSACDGTAYTFNNSFYDNDVTTFTRDFLFGAVVAVQPGSSGQNFFSRNAFDLRSENLAFSTFFGGNNDYFTDNSLYVNASNEARGVYVGNGADNNRFYLNRFERVTAPTAHYVMLEGPALNNAFNDSSGRGNYYPDASLYSFVDSDGDGYADSGVDYPYNGSLSKWSGAGADWGPIFHGETFGGSPQNPVSNGAYSKPGYSGPSATPLSARGGNLSYLDLFSEQQTGRWHAVFGNVEGEIVLKDSAGNSFYEWVRPWYEDLQGEVIASTDFAFDFSSVQPENDASLLDSVWSFSRGSDRFQDTFTASSNNAFELASTQIPANSALDLVTQTTFPDDEFHTTVVGDGGDPNSRNSYAFAGIINEYVPGYNATAFEFQLLVPVALGETNNYYVFVEID